MPGSPSIFKAIEQTSNSVTLEWNAPSQDGGSKINGYNIEINEFGSDEWFPENTSLIKGNSFNGKKSNNKLFFIK